MMAWIQLYDSDREIVGAVISTFASVFPDVHVFRPTPSARDLLMLGIRSTRATTAEDLSLAFALAGPRAMAELAQAGIGAPGDIDSLRLGPTRAPLGARAVTDDNSWIEFRVADRMLAGTGEPPQVIVDSLRQ